MTQFHRLLLILVAWLGAIAAPFLGGRSYAAEGDLPAFVAWNDDAPFGSVVDECLPAAYESLEPGITEGDEIQPSPLHDSMASRRDERLIDRVTDPTSWLMNLRYRHQWNWPVHADDPDSQALQIRPTIPFRAWGQANILRVTVPYTIDGSGGPGIGDLQILDLIVFQEDWGRWGVGPSLQITPRSTSDEGTFQAGPAAGAVVKNKHWTVGVLTQNFFADKVAQSRIQPILAHKFNDRWAVGIGDSEFRYDWENASWTQLPLGVELDRIAHFDGQKIQLFVNPQYNFQRDASNSGWTVFVGLALLIPEA